MSESDWLRDAFDAKRNSDTDQPDDDTTPADEDEAPPSFDGGARSSMPTPGPSMNQLIRRAVFGGDLAGHQPRPPAA